MESAAAKWVLVVDDDDDSREAFVACLIDAGYLARGVMSGAAALEVLRTERPSLVLSDLFMTGMTGKELLIHLRQLDVRVPPFVFVTGAAPSNVEDISGAVLYKPVDSDQLLAVVAHHCS